MPHFRTARFLSPASRFLWVGLLVLMLATPRVNGQGCNGVPKIKITGKDLEFDFSLAQIVADAPVSPIFNTFYQTLIPSIVESYQRGCGSSVNLWGAEMGTEDGSTYFSWDRGASAIGRVPNFFICEDFTFHVCAPLVANLAPELRPCEATPRTVRTINEGGEMNLYAFHAGTSPYPQKFRGVEYSFCDELVIEKPAEVTLDIPFHASGSVYAAESFGDTALTYARAALKLQGSIAGQAVNGSVQVESEAPIPEDESVNLTGRMIIPQGLTTSTAIINLTGTATLDVKVKGGSRNGLLAGAATAGVSFPNTIEVGITGPNNTAIPAGVRIYSSTSGTIYIDTRVFRGQPNFLTTATLRRDSQTNEILVDVTVTNIGPGEARSVQLTTAKLGATLSTTSAQSIGRLIPELPAAQATRTFRFAASAGTSGAPLLLQVRGNYTGGAFGGDVQVTLP